jgi:diguanylate cyclase (GGDEF)-like protein/PAS domain S-box-containing protein
LARAVDNTTPSARDAEATSEALRAELQAKTATLELFEAVTTAANESTSTDEAMQICVDRMCAYTRWPVGHVYMVKGDPPTPVSTWAWHVDDERLFAPFKRATMRMTWEPGMGLPGMVISARAPQWLRDVVDDADIPRREVAASVGLRSAVAFPALWRGEVVAVLEFFTRDEVEPDDALMRAMSYIGAQAGRVVERKRAEEALRSSEALKAAMLEVALDCIITADQEGRIIDFNPAAERTFGRARDDVVGREVAATIIPESLRDAHRKGLEHYLATGEGPVLDARIEVTALRADGSEFPVELAIHAIDIEGRPVFTAYLRDISERKALEQHLEHRAYHDPLTDLANRRLLVDRVEHALARCDRDGGAHSLIMLDLDNFKAVNDTLGHAAGDEVLVRVAERLAGRLRPGDTVARLGGDEFAVLLEDTDGATARVVAERVTADIAAPLELPDAGVPVAASAGVATGSPGGADAEELLRRADEAMYAAKHRGGSGVAVFAADDG